MIPLTEAQAVYYADLPRLRGKRGALLELLLDQRWHSNFEVARVGGLSFNSSIAALRREGWRIESRPKGHGVWEYRLVGKGDPPPPRMSRPQQAIANHYDAAIRKTLGGQAVSTVREALPDWMNNPTPANQAASRGVDCRLNTAAISDQSGTYPQTRVRSEAHGLA